ncbi:MAG TPA: hypothetical protein VHX65_08180 [Pirellulales bacterium]|nr:hypothetical protein [Pirellulales bacterium]
MIDPDRSVRFRWPVIAAIYQAVAWCSAWAFLVLYVPRFERIFRDFKMELPAAAKLVISLTHFLYDWWFLCFAPIGAWAGAVLAVGVLLQKTRCGLLERAWYLLTALLPIAVLVLAGLAIMLPLGALIDNLSR